MINSLIEVFGWPTIVLAVGQVVNFIGIGWAAFRPEPRIDSAASPPARTIGVLWRRFGAPGLVIACGWLIVTGGAIWSQYDQRVSELEGAREEREWRKEQADTLTGGDYFPTIHPSTPYENKNVFELKIQNKGPFPQYDVAVRIDNVTQRHAIVRQYGKETSPEIAMQKGWSLPAVQENEREGRRWRQIGNIPSGSLSSFTLGDWPASDPLEQVFWIAIQSRNAYGLGSLVCFKRDGVWHFETKMGVYILNRYRTNYFDSGPILPTGPIAVTNDTAK